jgi:hypothetical protein
MIEDLVEMNSVVADKSTEHAAVPVAEAHARTAARDATGFDWLAYVEIARPDHWFKNVFMLYSLRS